MNLFGVFGAGGCGRGVMPLVRPMLPAFPLPCKLVFVDDRPVSTVVNGQDCITYDDFLAYPATSRRMVLAVANGRQRELLANRCEADGVGFFDVRAPSMVQMDDVVVGIGAVLSPFVTLTSNVRIGKHFHANLYSYVEHDCVIGDYVTFAPGVMCNGNVVIEDHVFVGAGAMLRQGGSSVPLVIGCGATVGMGAVVTRSIAAGSTVAGNPARLMARRK